MSSSSSLLVQKGLLALSLVAALVLLCVLARRRLSAYEETSRARNNLFVEVLANVSEGLDRIEAGLDDIASRAAAAKMKLGQLVAARRQNLLTCALLRERRQQQNQRLINAEVAKKKSEETTSKTSEEKLTTKGQIAVPAVERMSRMRIRANNLFGR